MIILKYILIPTLRATSSLKQLGDGLRSESPKGSHIVSSLESQTKTFKIYSVDKNTVIHRTKVTLTKNLPLVSSFFFFFKEIRPVLAWETLMTIMPFKDIVLVLRSVDLKKILWGINHNAHTFRRKMHIYTKTTHF